ncbi:MAG: hypothetical protein QOE96_1575, partial [Blastocatellia bacterium]|nr:hypothetical protein [Blastocatellia bacterium]
MTRTLTEARYKPSSPTLLPQWEKGAFR